MNLLKNLKKSTLKVEISNFWIQLVTLHWQSLYILCKKRLNWLPTDVRQDGNDKSNQICPFVQCNLKLPLYKYTNFVRKRGFYWLVLNEPFQTTHSIPSQDRCLKNLLKIDCLNDCLESDLRKAAESAAFQAQNFVFGMGPKKY